MKRILQAIWEVPWRLWLFLIAFVLALCWLLQLAAWSRHLDRIKRGPDPWSPETLKLQRKLRAGIVRKMRGPK